MAEMDDKVIVTKNKITTIADTIREEGGTSDLMTLDEMPDNIRAIAGGGGASNIVAPLFTKSGNTYSCNKTWSEINEIYGGNTMSSLASMPQYIVTYNDNRSMFCDVEQYSEDAFLFSFYMATNSNKSVRIVTLSYENVGQSGTIYFSSDKTIEYQESIEACKFTYNSSTNKYICNKTYAQLWNMFFETSNTKLLTPYVITREGDISNTCRIQKGSMGGGDYLILFQFYIGADLEGGYGQYCNRYFIITVEPDNTIGGAYETTQYQPKLTSSNFRNGIEMVAEYGENKIGLTEEVRKDISTSLMIGNASGSVASIIDGADDLPLKSCIVAIEPVQSGSGDPSPQNERPISGWTECNITKISKNFFDKTTYSNKKFISSTGVINASDNWSISDYIGIKGNSSYILSGVTNAGTVACHCFYDKSKNFISSILSTPQNFTTPTNAYYVRLSMKTETPDSVQFELGSIATEFAQYVAPTTYNIQFPSEAGTVYGGALDVTNGVLTVDRAMVVLEDLSWNYTTNRASTILPNCVIPTSSQDPDAIAEKYIGVKSSSTLVANDFAIVSSSGNAQLLFYYDGTAITGKLVYKMATPTTYNLTPTEIKTLLGINNIFADTGDINNVEYTRDATSIINWLIAQINLGA